jgi:hypothetical protein
MINLAEKCPVCSEQIIYMSPKHISQNNCKCQKNDLYASEETYEKPEFRVGVLHTFNGELFVNKFPAGTRIVDGVITKLKAKSISDPAIEKEVDSILGI